MAVWQPLGPGFRRNVALLNGSGAVIVYATDELTVDTDGVTTMVLPSQIENDVGLPQLGSTSGLAPSGTILRNKQLIAGPSRGVALVALVYAPPGDFSGGNRDGLQITVNNVLEFVYYLTYRVGASGLYRVEETSFGKRAEINIIESKTYNVGIDSVGEVISQVAPNHGKLYYKYNIPCVLDSAAVRVVSGQESIIRYVFRSEAPVKARPSDEFRGFALALPRLGYLSRYRLTFDTTTRYLTSIAEETPEEMYELGEPLP
jgi:hypothetical protein